MQEGMLSLMQMAKTCGALARLSEAKLPYISLMTHPTTGGVTASFATIGDINLAEPKCMIGFAGPRVVKETTHQNLPPGFQTAEFMLEHGLIDAIVTRPKMKEKEYEHELRRLHGELVAMQEWIKATGAKVCIVFEGRDTAGKGGTIKAITERVSPRVFRVMALASPTDREKSQLYIQRYLPHMPAAGEVVIWDRSWYNRAGVEHVMGFCSREEYDAFMIDAPAFEKHLVSSGICLIKFWFSVSRDEQRKRFKQREVDPLKQWKLSPVDTASLGKWEQYTAAKQAMFAATDTPHAPWIVINSDCKKRARLNAMRYVLSHFQYSHKNDKDIAALDPLLVSRAMPGAEPAMASRKAHAHRMPHLR